MKRGAYVRYDSRTNLFDIGDNPDLDTDFGSEYGGNGLTHFHDIFRICCSYEKNKHT